MIDLGEVVQEILEEYGSEVEGIVAKSLPEVAEKTVNLLHSSSPKHTGKYAEGWTYETTMNKLGRETVIVYNEKKPTLTHLLEFGHQGFALKDGGRTRDVGKREHIKPRRDYAEDLIVKKIEEEMR